MRQVNNEILKNPRYITKSKITRAELNKMGIPKSVTVKEAKQSFECCRIHSIEVIGNPYNEYQQKHIKFVPKQALYREIIKGFPRKR